MFGPSHWGARSALAVNSIGAREAFKSLPGTHAGKAVFGGAIEAGNGQLEVKKKIRRCPEFVTYGRAVLYVFQTQKKPTKNDKKRPQTDPFSTKSDPQISPSSRPLNCGSFGHT